jgi:hypothetical protein
MMVRRLCVALAVIVGCLVVSATPGIAATQVSVDCGAGANLQAAINAAAPGTILAVSGTCRGPFTVGKNLVLKGVSSAVLDGQRAGTTLTVTRGKVRVTKMAVTGGRAADQGGGIANAGSLTVIRVTITANETGGFAAGIFNTGTAVLQRSAVTSNTTLDVGGDGVWNEGSMTIDHSVVSGNPGGIRNRPSGLLSISYSTVSGNVTMPEPGGVWNQGTATILASTIANNRSGNSHGGGIENGGTITIVASTIASNNADEGGGGLLNGGTATIAATVIAGNTWGADEGPSDCDGHISSNGYNLIGSDEDLSSPACFLTGSSTDEIGGPTPIDAMLNPLGSYGGPTQTMAPRSASPAVNAIPVGAPGGLCPSSGTTDQRGIPRPQAGACDIGSVERKPKE